MKVIGLDHFMAMARSTGTGARGPIAPADICGPDVIFVELSACQGGTKAAS